MRWFDYIPPLGLPLLMFYFFSFIPLRKVRRARVWRATPCTIVSSSVEEDQTDSGLYRIALTYHYPVAGQGYFSSRYSFSPASATAGHRWKRRIARRLGAGASATCYVNPDDPWDAVIERGVTWDMVFMGALAVAFLGFFFFIFAHGAV